MKGLTGRMKVLDRSWRRDKVLELAYEGRTTQAIADTLRFNISTIERDLRYWNTKTGITDWLDKQFPFEYRKGIMTYDAITAYMWDIVKDTNQEPQHRINAANAVLSATDKKLNLIGGRETLKRTVKLITTLKQRTDLPQGSTTQNSKQTIVTEQETLTTRGPNN